MPISASFTRRDSIRLILGTTACLTSGTALSQAVAYPSRPVRIIVPFTAGGTTDIFARLVGDKVSQALGQQFIIDNRGGAGGENWAEARCQGGAGGGNPGVGAVGAD